MSTRLLKKQLAALAAAQESPGGGTSSAAKSGNPSRVQKRKGQKRSERKLRRERAQTTTSKISPTDIAKRNLAYFQRTIESKAAAKTALLMNEVGVLSRALLSSGKLRRSVGRDMGRGKLCGHKIRSGGAPVCFSGSSFLGCKAARSKCNGEVWPEVIESDRSI
jgi:hypothetical protein